VKVHVTDGTGEAVFVLFDSDVNYLIEKQCYVLVDVAKVSYLFYGMVSKYSLSCCVLDDFIP